MSKLNLIGRRFGRLVVVASAGVSKRKSQWDCLCDCGGRKVVGGTMLVTGRTRSCGCLAREYIDKLKTHGHTSGGKSRTYKVWQGMHSRCAIPSATGYERYGGVGIRVCDRWSSYANFLDDMGEAPHGMSIDRKDSAKDYCKDNCRWATRQMQNENRSSVRWIEYGGRRMNITQWAAYLGIHKATLREALKKYPVEYALRERR